MASTSKSRSSRRGHLHLVGDEEVITPAEVKNPEDVGSRLVLALEASYNAIRLQHPDVPAAVIVISSSESKYGHYARSRWNIEGCKLPEIMVSAEGLKRSPREVLGTLIHEAAHGLAHARQLACCGPDCKHFHDTSRDGKYHNKKFRELAEELGLEVEDLGKSLGHTRTSLPEEEHPELVAELEPKLVAWREFDVKTKGAPRTNREQSLNCRCSHPKRTIRVFPGIMELGPILCGVCGDEFC